MEVGADVGAVSFPVWNGMTPMVYPQLSLGLWGASCLSCLSWDGVGGGKRQTLLL